VPGMLPLHFFHRFIIEYTITRDRVKNLKNLDN